MKNRTLNLGLSERKAEQLYIDAVLLHKLTRDEWVMHAKSLNFIGQEYLRWLSVNATVDNLVWWVPCRKKS